MIDMASWGWPQITYIALSGLGLGFAIAKHGEHRKPYSMWDAMASIAIVYTLLVFGGFFS